MVWPKGIPGYGNHSRETPQNGIFVFFRSTNVCCILPFPHSPIPKFISHIPYIPHINHINEKKVPSFGGELIFSCGAN